MKRIVFISLIIFALLPAWSHGQEVAIDWARMDSLVADGFFSTARPMVERAWWQAQASGDGSECLRATFYLTAIDYAFAKDAVDSAIMRYSALARSLAGADKAVAYAFLLQSYDKVYSQRYYSYGRNSASDDPKLHYLLWHRQRMEDTLMACLDSIVAQDKVLRETSVEGYRMMFRCDSLTMPPIDSTLLGLLAQSTLNVNLRSLREKVLALFAGLYADGNANGRLWFDLQRPAYIPSDSLYLVSLDSLEECYHGVMLSDDMRALLNYKRASAMSVAGHKVMAEELCLETERRYPDTYGGCCCRQLRKQICSKEFTINYSRTESSCGKRLAVVEARNTDLLHMRLVRRDSLPEGRLWPKDTLWGIDAVAEWEQPLPDPGDHLAHRWLVALPAVEQGQYYLMAYADRMEYALYESADAAFIAYSLPAAAGKWTQLSPSSGHLVDRVTGMPLAGRKVTLHGEGVLTENDRRCRRRTDKEGYFHFPVSSARYWLTDYHEMSANVDGYEYFYGGNIWRDVVSNYGLKWEDGYERQHLDLVMTDKPIYRLGDTVRFSCVAYDRRERGSDWHQKVRPAKNVKLTAVLRCSDESCDTVLLKTDEHGRCWGSFVVPKEGQNGGYRLSVWSDDHKYYCYKYFEVEAYKPPRFTVTLSPVGEGIDTVAVRRMGQPVTLYGMAASYSGAPMTGARVRWEVSRERLRSPLQWNTLADEYPYHDSLTVDDDGRFQFTFTPTPEESDTDRYATYIYTAYARVTDADGELRESHLSVRVSGADGYCMLTAGDLRQLTFVYNNFDHQPLEGAVRVRMERLRQPDTLRVLDKRLMAEWPDARWVGSEADFRRWFPSLAFTREESDPRHWPVEGTRIDTITKERTLALGELPSGMYHIVFDMPDGTHHDTVVNHVAVGGRVTGTDMVWLRATPRCDYWNRILCREGDTVRIEMGSPYESQPLYYVVSYAGKIYRKGMMMLGNERTTSLVIPVTKKTRNGFKVMLSAVRDGRVFQHYYEVGVQRPDMRCNIATETFRDKLQPGEREQWRLRITDADSVGVEANLCMTMYDMSLEQYRSFSYGFMPWYRSVGDLWAQLDFSETLNLHVSPEYISFDSYVVGYEPRFGFGLWNLDNWYKQVAMRFGPGTLIGTVVDGKTGEELPFVNVVLKYGGKQMNVVYTDFDGRFVIKSLPKGDYDLEVSFVGYARFAGKVKINGTGVTVFNIKLTPTATSLECVEIVEDRVPCIEIGAPENGARISSDDIARMPGTIDDEIVASVGGIGYDDGITGTARGESNMVTMQGNVRKRTGINVPKDAIAEIASPFDFDGTSSVALRQNLSTVAFFEPALRSDKDGSVGVEFTVPDALTQWRLAGFAWTDNYALGNFNRTLQTQKELMVQPQMPRFLRQGDTVELRAKVSNLGDSVVTARVGFEVGGRLAADTTLTLAAHTGGIVVARVTVDRSWKMAEYKVVARSGRFGDGERGVLPVLADKERVTTSRLLYIAGSPDGREVSRTYTLPFVKRQEDDSITIAFTANPIDYAIEALPHFKRHRMPGNIYKANSIYVDHLISQLPKNTDKERSLAAARVKSQTHSLLQDQHGDGGWSWMPKGRKASRYTTEAVLQRLASCPSWVNDNYYKRYYTKAIAYIDRQIVEEYKRDSVGQNCQLSTLYTRSLWMNVKPLDECDSLTRQAYAYYLQLARMHGMQRDLKLRSRGQLALTLLHMGDTAEAVRVATRIRESAHVADTLGMYWNERVWYQSPVEDAALMVDVMAEVLHDWEAVGRIQQWILSYRQGTTWRTDMATAAAVSALLRQSNGKTMLDSAHTATLTVNGSEVVLRSTSPFPAWGAVFYSHDTHLDSIRADGTGITLRKTISTVATDGSLTLLKPGHKLQVGERVRVHIDIYCERDYDRMALRDQRAAGFEPVSTASGWRWNDGLRYYVDVRDEAVDCYIDHLADGHYYVEYDLWVRHAGTFSNGICTLQNVYAPEFRANTGSEVVNSSFPQ